MLIQNFFVQQRQNISMRLVNELIDSSLCVTGIANNDCLLQPDSRHRFIFHFVSHLELSGLVYSKIEHIFI